MPRPKGSQNKLTTEVKEQLQNLIDEVVNSIAVDAMTTDQKLKLLQLSLHYVLPKLRSTETSDKKQEDLPLFVDVEVIKRDEETGGWTSDVYPSRGKEVS
jgi:uncharacterized protein YtpQ (UPF0354 family)